MPVQAPPSALSGTLAFFDRLGMFDVLLPFLLVFTIVFAILEKTKVYGMEKAVINGKTEELPRKNLNAMTAFVVAFFVVASSQLVAIINQTLAHTVLVLILILCFMLLVGAMHSGKEEFSLEKYKGWKAAFMVLIFISIVLIFLNATGWLQQIYWYVMINWDGVAVSSIGLVIIIIAAILWITHDRGAGEQKSEG